jgi:hypothetical protein
VLIGHLGADVAPPDHLGARLDRGSDQTQRLRVVQDHHVTGADVLQERRALPGADLVVVPTLLLSQRAAVAGGTVQTVVHPLGQGEEGRIACRDEPSRVHSGSSGVRDEAVQHLGDAPAGGGGVDVPHLAAVELVLRAGRELLEPL